MASRSSCQHSTARSTSCPCGTNSCHTPSSSKPTTSTLSRPPFADNCPTCTGSRRALVSPPTSSCATRMYTCRIRRGSTRRGRHPTSRSPTYGSTTSPNEDVELCDSYFRSAAVQSACGDLSAKVRAHYLSACARSSAQTWNVQHGYYATMASTHLCEITGSGTVDYKSPMCGMSVSRQDNAATRYPVIIFI